MKLGSAFFGLSDHNHPHLLSQKMRETEILTENNIIFDNFADLQAADWFSFGNFFHIDETTILNQIVSDIAS